MVTAEPRRYVSVNGPEFAVRQGMNAMSVSGVTDNAVGELVLLMPRLAARLKRLPVPEPFGGWDMTPRHLQLLSCLLLEGPQSISALAEHLSIAPTTVSMIVGELNRTGVLVRRELDADRRRRIVAIDGKSRPTVEQWLSPSLRAWQHALGQLAPAQRRMLIDTLTAYEAALSNEPNKAPPI